MKTEFPDAGTLFKVDRRASGGGQLSGVLLPRSAGARNVSS
jgi:hypothetical protein